MSESGQSGRGKRGPRRSWQDDNGRDNNSGDRRYRRDDPKPTRDNSHRDNQRRDNQHRDSQGRDSRGWTGNAPRRANNRDGWTPRDRADRPRDDNRRTTGRDNDRRTQNWTVRDDRRPGNQNRTSRDDRRSGSENWTPRNGDRRSQSEAGRDDRRSGRDNWTPRDNDRRSSDRPTRGDSRDPGRRDRNWIPRDDNRRTGSRDSAGWPRRDGDRRSGGRDTGWTPRDDNRRFGSRDAREDDRRSSRTTRDDSRRSGGWTPRDRSGNEGQRRSTGRNANWSNKDRPRTGRDNPSRTTNPRRTDDKRNRAAPPPAEPDLTPITVEASDQERVHPAEARRHPSNRPASVHNQAQPEPEPTQPPPAPRDPSAQSSAQPADNRAEHANEPPSGQPATQPQEPEHAQSASEPHDRSDQPGDDQAMPLGGAQAAPQGAEAEQDEPGPERRHRSDQPGDQPQPVNEAPHDQPAERQSGRPELPEEATLSLLDPDIRAELRTLPRNLAEIVGRHLAAAGLLIDDDPELALQHARFARTRAARIAVVREAVGLTAYHAGEWAEALSELRAARRMSNGPGHVAVMADCERALGRPERALELARESRDLPPNEAIELKIVAAGARRDMGQLDAAVVALQIPELDPNGGEPWTARLCYAYADNLAAAGRTEDAIRWFLNAAQADDDGDTDAAERAIELSHPEGVQPLPDEIT